MLGPFDVLGVVNVLIGRHLVRQTVVYFLGLINWCLVACWVDNVCGVDNSDGSSCSLQLLY